MITAEQKLDASHTKQQHLKLINLNLPEYQNQGRITWWWEVQVTLWSLGLGSRMTFVKLLLPFLILHSCCEGSNQPPRFLNYFFSTYLLIYEDMPVGSWASVQQCLSVVQRAVSHVPGSARDGFFSGMIMRAGRVIGQ
ncbi:hypothetical protein PAMP_001926 [Pampus punctatissimus]